MKPRVKDGKRIHGKYNSNPLTKISNSNPCCFFKLFVSPTIQLKMLRLPDMFASAFRNKISEACHLTVPTGETHQVALIEQDSKLWFRDGWELFVNRFSISFGYFMVFTYKGNSNFKVKLFDPTACEISYCCDEHNSSPMRSEPNNLGDHTPELSEQLDDVHHKNVVENMHKTEDVAVKIEELSETESSHLESELPIWLSNCKEEMRAVAAAGIPIPTNPFFVALVKPYVLTKSFLNIPNAFAQRHMKCKTGHYIKIERGDGRQWLVRCCRGRSYFNFGKGWLEFVRHACLEVGDVCLFELTDAKNSVLKIHVSKLF